jgi:hypothetical protein
MPQLLPRRLVLPVTDLVGTLLLHDCSQASSDTATDSTLASDPSPTPTKRTTGTAADSLNGMQGHTFSEPLRNFPGLLLLKKENDRCVRVYQMSAGQERSLSGKHAKYSTPYYQFQDGQFAMAEAITTGTGASPMAMREEALLLFGLGKERHDLMGGLDWEGGADDILRKTGAPSTVRAVSIQQATAAGAAGQVARATAGG